MSPRVQVVPVVVSEAQLRAALRSPFLGLRRAPRRMPLVQVPQLVFAAYAARIDRVTDRMRNAIRRDWLGALGHLRLDAAGDRRPSSIGSRHPKSWLPRLPDPKGWLAEAERAARIAAEDAAIETRRLHARGLQRALGVRVELGEPWLARAVDEFTRLNAGLITGISERMADEIAAATQEALVQGVSGDALAERIVGLFLEAGEEDDRAKTRARIVARDQLGKLGGEMARLRAEELGVSHYTWVTRGDDSVRLDHRRRNGRVFSWRRPMGAQLDEMGISHGPDPGFPGEEIMCRCLPAPDLTDLFR